PPGPSPSGGIAAALAPLTPGKRPAEWEEGGAARRRRAELKNQLKYAQTTLSDVVAVAEEDEAVAKMRVSELLESLPGVGKVKARAIMADIGIADSRRVRGLGAHQLAALLERFG